jgi:hypothetical protein
MDYRPITDDELDELQEAVTAGATREQSRRLLAELRRAETERARLQNEHDALTVGRMQMRAALTDEIAAERRRADELQAWLDAIAVPREQVGAALREWIAGGDESDTFQSHCEQGLADFLATKLSFRVGDAVTNALDVDELRGAIAIAKDLGFEKIACNVNMVTALLDELELRRDERAANEVRDAEAAEGSTMAVFTNVTMRARYERSSGQLSVKVSACGEKKHEGVELVEVVPSTNCYADGSVLSVEINFKDGDKQTDRWSTEATFDRSADYVVLLYDDGASAPGMLRVKVLSVKPVDKV